MREAGVIGIARVVMHTKENLAALVPDGEALMLNTIRWAAEIRPRGDIALPPAGKAAAKLKEGELKMARQLVGDMTTTWKPDDFADEFTAAIHKLAAQRVSAGKTEKVTAVEDEAAPAAASNVVDLTELLRQSLASRQPKKSKAEAAPARKSVTKKTARRRAA